MPYGAMTGNVLPLAEKPLMRSYRRRMNAIPMFCCIFAPWLLFIIINCTVSFSIHYGSPGLCWFIVFLGLLCVIVSGCYAGMAVYKKAFRQKTEPTWIIFLFLSLLVAWILAVVMGDINYTNYLQTYYSYGELNTYRDVKPDRQFGEQLMDAGSVEFHQYSFLDLPKSMGFKSYDIYCVAPVGYGRRNLATYDYWVVGKNCCSGNATADFQCGEYANPKAKGGLRLVNPEERAFYRLAVQQAESIYHIKANHPLFFTWMENTTLAKQHWKAEGMRLFKNEIYFHLVLQIFCVATAAIGFSKLGHI